MSGQGLKYDTGKDPWHLLPMGTIRGIVKVLAYGAKKYGPNNWQQVENGESRYYAAMMRHIVAHLSGEELDPESGLPHLDHALCSLMFWKWLTDNPQQSLSIEEMIRLHPEVDKELRNV